jgi:hypothetical protein
MPSTAVAGGTGGGRAVDGAKAHFYMRTVLPSPIVKRVHNGHFSTSQEAALEYVLVKVRRDCRASALETPEREPRRPFSGIRNVS